MVEVVAENYHNIWAKKKKSDLGSRGGFLMKSEVEKFTLVSVEVTLHSHGTSVVEELF